MYRPSRPVIEVISRSRDPYRSAASITKENAMSIVPIT
jgi:hypothetical protein